MPAASQYMPEDWLTMRAALQAWLEDETALTVVLDEQNAPSPARPFIRWGVLVPPVQDGRLEMRNVGPAFVVDEVLDSTVYSVTLDGDLCSITSDADATALEIRNALIAEIEAETDYQTIVVSDSVFSIIGNPSFTFTNNLLVKLNQQSLGEAIMTISVEALTASASQQAMTVISGLIQSLETEPVIESLAVAGISVASVEGVRKLDVVTAGKWEDRAGFDVRLRVRTRNSKLIDILEDIGTVGGTLEA